MVTGGHDPKATPAGRVWRVFGVFLLVGFVLIAHALGYDSNRFY
jgi:hypothetical protein